MAACAGAAARLFAMRAVMARVQPARPRHDTSHRAFEQAQLGRKVHQTQGGKGQAEGESRRGATAVRIRGFLRSSAGQGQCVPDPTGGSGNRGAARQATRLKMNDLEKRDHQLIIDAALRCGFHAPASQPRKPDARCEHYRGIEALIARVRPMPGIRSAATAPETPAWRRRPVSLPSRIAARPKAPFEGRTDVAQLVGIGRSSLCAWQAR